MPSAAQVRAGGAYVEIFARAEPLIKGLRGLGDTVARTARAAAALSAAFATGVSVAVAKATKDFAAFGDAIQKAGLRTGMTAEMLSTLKFAAEQSGSSFESLTAAIFRSQRRIQNATFGTGPAVRALNELGLSAEKLNALDPAQQFFAIVDALNQMPGDVSDQLGFEIFGDNLRDIKPLLDEGVDGIRALQDEARQLGLELSTEQAEAAAKVADAYNRLGKTAEAAWLQIGAAASENTIIILDKLTGVVSSTVEWVQELNKVDGLFSNIAKAIEDMPGTIEGIGDALASVFEDLKNDLMTFFDVLGTNLEQIMTRIATDIINIPDRVLASFMSFVSDFNNAFAAMGGPEREGFSLGVAAAARERIAERERIAADNIRRRQEALNRRLLESDRVDTATRERLPLTAAAESQAAEVADATADIFNPRSNANLFTPIFDQIGNMENVGGFVSDARRGPETLADIADTNSQIADNTLQIAIAQNDLINANKLQ